MSNRDQTPHLTTYTGRHVVSTDGNGIGTVTDVIYDDSRGLDPAGASRPAWLVVDPGPLRAAHYVPVAGSYGSQRGDIVVPWEKAWVKSSPKARGSHVLSSSDRHDLAVHYQSNN
jgi:hypothetical protein